MSDQCNVHEFRHITYNLFLSGAGQPLRLLVDLLKSTYIAKLDKKMFCSLMLPVGLHPKLNFCGWRWPVHGCHEPCGREIHLAAPNRQNTNLIVNLHCEKCFWSRLKPVCHSDSLRKASGVRIQPGTILLISTPLVIDFWWRN